MVVDQVQPVQQVQVVQEKMLVLLWDQLLVYQIQVYTQVVAVEQFNVVLEEIQDLVVVDEVEQTLLLVVVLVHLILVVEVEVLEILQDQVELVVQELYL
tara:strand:+ start:366 stop:662 length:297 start_codon:yes stop_codon:yes gene_type:complete